MEDNQNNQQYLIPRNVNTRFTFFEGFGWKELFLCLLGVGIGILLFLILSIFFRNVFIKGIIAVFPVAAAFTVTRENPRTGMSLLKLLKDFRDYVGQQKLFLYYHGKGRE